MGNYSKVTARVRNLAAAGDVDSVHMDNPRVAYLVGGCHLWAAAFLAVNRAGEAVAWGPTDTDCDCDPEDAFDADLRNDSGGSLCACAVRHILVVHNGTAYDVRGEHDPEELTHGGDFTLRTVDDRVLGTLMDCWGYDSGGPAWERDLSAWAMAHVPRVH